MADLVYDVEVRYHSVGNLNSGLQRLGSQSQKFSDSFEKVFSKAGDFGKNLASSFNNTFDSLASSMLSATASIAAGIGTAVAVGLGHAVKIGMEFNSEIEQAQLGIASILNANGVSTGMLGGLRDAAEMTANMRKDAADLPGEFKDLQNMVATVMNPGLQAGLNSSIIESMSAQAMSVAAIMHVSQPVAAREMAMMLEGNARHNMPFAQRLNLGDLKAFNKLSAAERAQKLSEALGKHDSAMPDQAKSWVGVTSTAKDKIRSFFGDAVKPLQSLVGSRLFELFNQKGAKYSQRVAFADELKHKLSTALMAAFHTGENFILRWYEPVKTFGHTLYEGLHNAFSRVQPIVEAIGNKVREFMMDPAALDKIAHVLKMAIALRAGSAGAEMGFGMMGGLGKLAGGLGSIGGEGGAIAGLAAVGPAALAAAVGIGILAAGAAGVASSLADTNSIFHDTNLQNLSRLEESGRQLGTVGSKFWDLLKPAFEFIGTIMLTTFAGIVEGFTLFALYFVPVVKGIEIAARKFMGLFGVEMPDGTAKPGAKAHDEYGRTERDRDEDDGRKKDLKPPQHTTHIHKVEIKVEGNEDPARVADLTIAKLIDMSKNPTRSPHTPNMFGGRGF